MKTILIVGIGLVAGAWYVSTKYGAKIAATASAACSAAKETWLKAEEVVAPAAGTVTVDDV